MECVLSVAPSARNLHFKIQIKQTKASFFPLFLPGSHLNRAPYMVLCKYFLREPLPINSNIVIVIGKREIVESGVFAAVCRVEPLLAIIIWCGPTSFLIAVVISIQ